MSRPRKTPVNRVRPGGRPIPHRPATPHHGPKPAPPPRIDVAVVRREQIVEAAAQIIATRGIQHLSLSAIEAVTGMSRGQLTYYFKAKEDIVLAVFERTVRRMATRCDRRSRRAGTPRPTMFGR